MEVLTVVFTFNLNTFHKLICKSLAPRPQLQNHHHSAFMVTNGYYGKYLWLQLMVAMPVLLSLVAKVSVATSCGYCGYYGYLMCSVQALSHYYSEPPQPSAD